MARFTDKSVLITGGSGGMGRATAAAFLREGASVVVADIDAAGIDSTVAGLSTLGPVSGIRTDVTKPADCLAAVEAAVARHGHLDMLVNGAGVWVEGPAQEVTEAEWDRTIDSNLKGTFFCCRHAIPHLVESGGAIVNVISDAGLMGYAGTSVYCASKGGATLLTKSLGLELAPKGKENDAAIVAARAKIELAEASADAGEAGELAARVERDPDDLQARYDLAMALVGKGDHAGAIDALLELFRRDREWNDGAAKAQLFKLFGSLGPKHEAAQKGRRRLSSMIFA